RLDIGFEGFMVMRLLARHMLDPSSVSRDEAGHTARKRDRNVRLVAYCAPLHHQARNCMNCRTGEGLARAQEASTPAQHPQGDWQAAWRCRYSSHRPERQIAGASSNSERYP